MSSPISSANFMSTLRPTSTRILIDTWHQMKLANWPSPPMKTIANSISGLCVDRSGSWGSERYNLVPLMTDLNMNEPSLSSQSISLVYYNFYSLYFFVFSSLWKPSPICSPY
jgi:hypothetical protein